MKRLLALLAMLAMVLCLAACDKDAVLGAALDTDEAMPHIQKK